MNKLDAKTATEIALTGTEGTIGPRGRCKLDSICEDNLAPVEAAIIGGGHGLNLVDWLDNGGWDRVPELLEGLEPDTAGDVNFGLGYLQGVGEARGLTSLQVLESAGWDDAACGGCGAMNGYEHAPDCDNPAP